MDTRRKISGSKSQIATPKSEELGKSAQPARQDVSPKQTSHPESGDRVLLAFTISLGVFFGLCLLKFGNPPIMEKWVTVPKDPWEFVFAFPWPISWAYGLCSAVAFLGLIAARWRRVGAPSLIWLPIVWWVWTIISTIHSVEDTLSTHTVKHLS